MVVIIQNMATINTLSEPVTYIYDGTFEGFLCVVFRAFELKREPLSIIKEAQFQPTIFNDNIKTETVAEQTDRVWNGIVQRSSASNGRMLHIAFQSELPRIEQQLWSYLKMLFTSSSSIQYKNTLNEHVFDIQKVARKVMSEAHRMLGLVRFQLASDGTYFAAVAPDHNILWLIADHFKDRMADQQWIIYDTKRNVGLFYNLHEVTEVSFPVEPTSVQAGRLTSEVKDLSEDYYCNLWQRYYKSINIAERKNTKQMLGHMPRRYWKYLPEKDDLDRQ